MTLRVEWSEAAVTDLEVLGLYLAQTSPAVALRTLDRLEAAAAKLDRLPARGRIVPELAPLGIRHFRELVVRPYRIMYHLAEQRVLVLAVFDGRRDLNDILLERLLR